MMASQAMGGLLFGSGFGAPPSEQSKGFGFGSSLPMVQSSAPPVPMFGSSTGFGIPQQAALGGSLFGSGYGAPPLEQLNGFGFGSSMEQPSPPGASSFGSSPAGFGVQQQTFGGSLFGSGGRAMPQKYGFGVPRNRSQPAPPPPPPAAPPPPPPPPVGQSRGIGFEASPRNEMIPCGREIISRMQGATEGGLPPAAPPPPPPLQPQSSPPAPPPPAPLHSSLLRTQFMPPPPQSSPPHPPKPRQLLQQQIQRGKILKKASPIIRPASFCANIALSEPILESQQEITPSLDLEVDELLPDLYQKRLAAPPSPPPISRKKSESPTPLSQQSESDSVRAVKSRLKKKRQSRFKEFAMARYAEISDAISYTEEEQDAKKKPSGGKYRQTLICF